MGYLRRSFCGFDVPRNSKVRNRRTTKQEACKYLLDELVEFIYELNKIEFVSDVLATDIYYIANVNKKVYKSDVKIYEKPVINWLSSMPVPIILENEDVAYYDLIEKLVYSLCQMFKENNDTIKKIFKDSIARKAVYHELSMLSSTLYCTMQCNLIISNVSYGKIASPDMKLYEYSIIPFIIKGMKIICKGLFKLFGKEINPTKESVKEVKKIDTRKNISYNIMYTKSYISNKKTGVEALYKFFLNKDTTKNGNL